jgi:hypothetical protein
MNASLRASMCVEAAHQQSTREARPARASLASKGDRPGSAPAQAGRTGSMSKPMMGYLLVLVALGAVIGIAYGWRGLFIYLFLAAIPVLYLVATVIGGGVVRGMSSGRFDSRFRRRS